MSTVKHTPEPLPKGTYVKLIGGKRKGELMIVAGFEKATGRHILRDASGMPFFANPWHVAKVTS